MKRTARLRRTPLKRIGKRGASLKELDALLRQVVIKRDDQCVMMGFHRECSGPLQHSHLLPKQAHPAMRYDLKNVHAMCRSHHLFVWHGTDPILPGMWATQHFGTAYLDALRQLSMMRRGGKLDKQAIRLMLEQELAGTKT